MGRIRTIYDNLMQGATLGFADEVTSGLASLPVALMTGQSIGDVYRQGQELDKRRLSKQREMYPYTSIASEIAGGIASPVSMKAAQYVGKGKGALGRAMAVGAGEGGLYGFGTGDGLENRAANTALGAALGGVSAGAAQSVVDDLARGSSSRIRQFIADESGTVNLGKNTNSSSIFTKSGKLRKPIENKLNRYLSEEANKNYYDRYISETTLKNIGLPPKSNDMVVGDTIIWIEPEFSGGYRNATFTGYSWNTGKIIKDSYGKKSGQHTFTIETPDGYTIRKKGRTLMKEYSGVLKPSEDRQVKLDEKHVRGREAKLSALRRWLNEHDESHPAYDDKLRRFMEMGGR